MLRVAVGHSNDPDSQAAIEDVLEQCTLALKGEMPQAGLLFAAIDFDFSGILQCIDQAFPGIELIGGTTDGEISSVLAFQQNSLTLMLFCAEGVEIAAGIGHNVSRDPLSATQQAVEQAKRKNSTEARLCLTLPEGLLASGVSIVENLSLALGTNIPIFGGLTADRWQFKTTYQFFQTEVVSDAVPILLFSGNLLFSCGVASGWSPIGKKGRVTRVEKNVLYEIDGQPALAFYRHYLGGLPPSSEYPLAVFDGDSEQYYVRAPSIHDPESGSVTFFADIPEHAFVQMTQTNREAILTASKASILQALERYPGTEPEATLFFSCASRRQILGTRTCEEYEIAKTCLGSDLQSCGFYTNGEIAPLVPGGHTQFHNETFVTLLLGTM